MQQLLAAVCAALVLSGCSPDQPETSRPAAVDQPAGTQQANTTGAGNIRGSVNGPDGGEAGVWVIAETDAFDTRYARIVVSNDEGDFLVPALPDADYRVWVRGYGLLDSASQPARPGDTLQFTLTEADPAEAAANYPAAYWYAMLDLPTDAELDAIDGGLNAYLTWTKNMGCVGCHQMGQAAIRTMPPELGDFASSEAAWARRIQSGQAGNSMMRIAAELLNGLPLKYLADWGDRIAKGELPHAHPRRPSGLERNVVATVRDWSSARAYLHDLSGTDRRNPTVNGYGSLFGAPELSTDLMPVMDPVSNSATSFHVPVRDPDTPSTQDQPVIAPSPYWGDEAIWDSQANIHNPMLDEEGRVWLTARIRGPDNPDFCRSGSDHPSASLFPTERAGRHLAVYDPASGDYQFVDTCYSTHHLQFDDDGILWTSGGGQVVGWLDAEKFLATGDAAASQGWAPLILDTNGNGRQDNWIEPGQSPDPELDTRVPAAFYAVMPNRVDGSIWGSNAFRYPGAIVRYDPETNLGERYQVPLPGFGVRGADIDSKGVIWVSLGSGHLGRFDRADCRGPLNGPLATGNHCAEGWQFFDLPGPGFKSLPEYSVESSYYTWVDQHNTLGLGYDVPIVTGNLFDGVHALVDGSFVTLRIPYPLGFYTKGFEGRIDDPDGDWKARGLWVPSGDRTPWLKEGGKGSKPLVVHFQMRPHPLAE
jgi:hypothetical protein